MMKRSDIDSLDIDQLKDFIANTEYDIQTIAIQIAERPLTMSEDDYKGWKESAGTAFLYKKRSLTYSKHCLAAAAKAVRELNDNPVSLSSLIINEFKAVVSRDEYNNCVDIARKKHEF